MWISVLLLSSPDESRVSFPIRSDVLCVRAACWPAVRGNGVSVLRAGTQPWVHRSSNESGSDLTARNKTTRTDPGAHPSNSAEIQNTQPAFPVRSLKQKGREQHLPHCSDLDRYRTPPPTFRCSHITPSQGSHSMLFELQ
jgi:hypothetical protein